MSLPVIDYLQWIEGRPAAVDHDLGSSDLRGAADPASRRVVPEQLAEFASPGSESLTELVARAYDVDPASVLVVSGASVANTIAAVTALDDHTDATSGEGSDHANRPDGFDPEGCVLVEKPAYEPLVDTPQLFGASIYRFLRREQDDWRLDPARVAAATVEETALVSVTNRHNPSGRLADRETLQATAAAARDVDARLLVDEVYAPYVVDPAPPSAADPTSPPPEGTAFGGVTAAGLEDTVVTGSLTKFHGLGGLGVGWLVADPAFLDRAARVADHFPPLPEPSRALGLRAFAHREHLERASRDLLERNARLLSTFVAERADLDGPVYEGASYALLAHETADGDRVAEAALERNLLVVPGRFFETPERFRVSLGRDTEHVREALDVLGGVLDEL